MKLRALSQPQARELLPAGNHVPGLSGKLIGRLAGIIFMAASSCSCLEAEEQFLSPPHDTQGASGSYFYLSRPSSSFALTLAPEATGLLPGKLFALTDDWRLKSLFQKTAADGLGHDSSIVLFRKQMPSRYSYHGWAGLRSGYGQFLAVDPVGRSRTNGVGIQDPSWVYLKMSLKF